MATEKNRLFTAPRGHPRQRKDFLLEAWRASKGNLPSVPVAAKWGTGVSPAVFRLLSSARKEGLGSKGQAWPLATGAGGRTQKENPQPGLGGHGSYWSSSFKLDGRTVSLCLAKFIE